MKKDTVILFLIGLCICLLLIMYRREIYIQGSNDGYKYGYENGKTDKEKEICSFFVERGYGVEDTMCHDYE